MKQKIIAVDFDGTLCENKYPNIGKPLYKSINYIKQLVSSQNYVVILWTCRRGKHLDDAVRWCAEHGIKLDYINENAPSLIKAFGGDCRKIYADIYLDDKAMNIKEFDDD